MNFKSIEIKEFRGIKQMRSLKLKKFNVIIGRNNSGKTALLEALFLFPVPFRSLSVPWYSKSRIETIAEFHSGIDALIYGYSGNAEITYEIDTLSEILNIKFVLNTDGVIRVWNDGKEVTFEDYLNQISSQLNLSKNALTSFTFYLSPNTNFIHKLHQYLCETYVWNTIVKNGANTRLIRKFVNNAVRDNFTEILLGPRKRLMLRKELSDDSVMYIDIADLGDGIERALLVALALEYISPKIVLIDDIEQSAHIGLLKIFIEWLAKKDWQVILTTHSIDVLSVLTEVDMQDFQLIALNKNQEDTVIFRTYSLEELENMLTIGIDLRKMLDLV